MNVGAKSAIEKPIEAARDFEPRREKCFGNVDIFIAVYDHTNERDDLILHRQISTDYEILKHIVISFNGRFVFGIFDERVTNV